MEQAIVQFLSTVSSGMRDLWFGVILRISWLEWAIAIPMVLTPVLKIVQFILGQIDNEGG